MTICTHSNSFFLNLRSEVKNGRRQMIREARVIMVGAMVRVMHSTLSNWFDSNLLTLNAEKSEKSYYILFRTKK